MIRPWLFTFMQPYQRQHPDPFDPAIAQHAIHWHLDELFPRIEALDFEGVFFSEHHFHGNMSASPHLYIAATAMRTRRLRLGVMGSVLPMHSPWRVVEDMAILDHLSQGRIDIGVSSGTGPQEPLAVGIPESELRARYEESLDIIDAALAHEEFSHHGRFWNFDRLCLTPRMFQAAPPKWMTIVTERSARMAAERGYRICTAFMSARDAREIFDAYRETAGQAGRSVGEQDLGLRRRCLVWDTDHAAEQLGAEVLRIGLERTGNTMKRAIERGLNPLIGIQAMDKAIMASRRAEAIDAPAAKFLSEPDEWIVGSPETVAAKIIDQCRTTGAGHMLVYTLGSMEKHEMLHSMKLWERVVPQLRKAELS